MTFMKLKQAVKVVQNEIQQSEATVSRKVELLPSLGGWRVVQLVNPVDSTAYFIEDVC